MFYEKFCKNNLVVIHFLEAGEQQAPHLAFLCM